MVNDGNVSIGLFIFSFVLVGKEVSFSSLFLMFISFSQATIAVQIRYIKSGHMKLSRTIRDL